MTRTTALLVGADIPAALVTAFGLQAVRTAHLDDAPEAHRRHAAVLVSHLSADSARSYHRLLARGAGVPLVFVDLPSGAGGAARRYTAERLREAAGRLAELTGEELDDGVLRRELVAEWSSATSSELPSTPGAAPVVFSGELTPHDRTELDLRGMHPAWVEPAHGYGEFQGDLPVGDWDVWATMARIHEQRVATSTRASLRGRAAALITRAEALDASAIVFSSATMTDADAWLRSMVEREARGRVDVVALASPDAAQEAASHERDTEAPGEKAERGERRRAVKSLTVTTEFGAYQREWFASIRGRAAAGEPFAVVNADAPQEVLRALDVPFVVNQWWASIAAAKGGTGRAKAALEAAGLPTEHESYNAQGIADHLAGEDGAAWGGLPTPQLLQAMRGEDAVTGIYEEWARIVGAELILFDRTVESRPEFPLEWWDLLPHDWDATLEADRLDLLAEQIEESIRTLERVTGRTLDRERLHRVLDLVNEQEEWYRKTRDLIATTTPAPVSIVDTIPATMIPQWHRGTEWGRDAARRFHDEVAARVAAGLGTGGQERLRLMWVGRGLWQHMWLYQAFERSHGAVFVWSMYLGLAADGYLRYATDQQDPLRALAARFVTVGDELRMPRWAAAWHVAEARRSGVDAVVAIDDAEPFVLDELERAGFPVLRLEEDNLAQSAEGIHDRIAGFLDGLA